MTRRQDGFAIVEVLMAIIVLAVGVLTVAAALDSSRRLDQVSQRKSEMAHQAQNELERVEALPYTQIAMTAAPTPSASPSSPDYYVTSAGMFTYNNSQGEPIFVDASNGTITPNASGSGCTDGCTRKWTDPSTGYSGEIFTFVVSYADPGCGTGCQPYKQITVAVTVDSAAHPATVWETTYKAPTPTTGSGNPSNPLSAPTTTCQNSSGVTVSCTNGLSSGTAQTYYLTDSAWTATYSPPTADHAVHHTVANAPAAPVPDQAISSLPGSTAATATSPPCYSTDVGCPSIGGSGVSGGMGREIVPVSTSGTTCGSPPQDNAKTELWLSPPFAANAVITGSGAMKLYTRTDPLAVAPSTVTLCMALYLETPSLLTSTTAGALFSSQIGNTIGVTLQEYPQTITPVTFNFNTGTPTTVSTDNSRAGVALWIAGSPGNVVFVYDHPSYASSIQLIVQ